MGELEQSDGTDSGAAVQPDGPSPAGSVIVPSALQPRARRISLQTGQALDIPHRERGLVLAVERGTLVLGADWGDGLRSVLSILLDGDALLTETCPPGARLTVTARTAAQAMLVHGDVDNEPALHRDLMRRAALQCSAMALHHAAVTKLGAEARLATLIVELVLRQHGRGAPGTVIGMPLTRSDMAGYLALNADTLSRLMSRLRTRGLLAPAGRDRLAIKDWQALCAMSPLTPSLEELWSVKALPLS